MTYGGTDVNQGWPVKALAQLGARITSGSRGWAKYYSDHGDLFVRITNLRRSSTQLDLRSTRFVQVDADDAEARRTRLRPGDILISITADIGIVGLVDEALPNPAYINQHIARVRLDPKVADSRFISYYLASWAPQRRFVGVTDQGAKAGMNLTAVANLTAAVPPVDEQRVIADALDDAVKQVDALERLIAKKRDIKQGMMQGLLTGRTRLAGFSEQWSEAQLGDVSSLKGRIGWQGLTQDEFTSNPAEPFLITGMNFKDGAIRWDEVYHVSEDRFAVAPEIQLRPGDVLMTKDGTIGKLLFVNEIPYPGKATLNSHLLLFRPRRGAYDPRFLYYQLGSARFAAHIDENKSGTTFFGISQTAVAKYAMVMPPLEEQRAIGQALSDIDADINALERRLESARAVKTGMMQELLTGHTRLPVEAAS